MLLTFFRPILGPLSTLLLYVKIWYWSSFVKTNKEKTMKKLILNVLLTSGVLIICSNALFAQDQTVFHTESRLTFNSESEERYITVGVSDINTILTLNIESLINSGHLTIEIYDPAGAKQGNFILGYQLKTDNESIKAKKAEVENKIPDDNLVSGNINKTIKNPLQGDWKIKIIPKNVTGIIGININHSSLK